MTLSKTSLETLIDLVEIRLGCVEVYDREDARELSALEQCRGELQAILDGGLAKKTSTFTNRKQRQAPTARATQH
ncbi:MAG: hypothetical protein ACTSUD_00980 [Alphaproteobacteria bacterium]